MKKITCCLLFVFLFPLSVSAGQLAYTCEITHVYNLEDDGALKSTKIWENQFVGSKFSLSRVTGEIIGEVLTTAVATSTKVINIGKEGYYFTSIAYFEGRPEKKEMQLIEVMEFNSAKKKPFVAMSLGGAGIVTGMCE